MLVSACTGREGNEDRQASLTFFGLQEGDGLLRLGLMGVDVAEGECGHERVEISPLVALHDDPVAGRVVAQGVEEGLLCRWGERRGERTWA